MSSSLTIPTSRMLKFLIVAVLLGACSAFVMPPKIPIKDAQAPPTPCCLPKQFEGNLHIITGTVQAGQGELSNVTARQSLDYTNMRAATEVLHPTNIRVIDDYNRMMQYVIMQGQCTATKITTKFDNCPFSNATYLGSFYFGGMQGLMMDGYQLMVPDAGTATVDVTRNGCIPVTEVIVSQSGATNPSISALGYVDVTLGIRDPAVFNVPHPLCPSEPDSKMPSAGFGFGRL